MNITAIPIDLVEIELDPKIKLTRSTVVRQKKHTYKKTAASI